MPVKPSPYVMIGCPSTKDFIKYVAGNMLPNRPINKSEIIHAEEILGPIWDHSNARLQVKHHREYI